jgi:uncharacterized ferritin-like protein (DUF455 family)
MPAMAMRSVVSAAAQGMMICDWQRLVQQYRQTLLGPMLNLQARLRTKTFLTVEVWLHLIEVYKSGQSTPSA